MTTKPRSTPRFQPSRAGIPLLLGLGLLLLLVGAVLGLGGGNPEVAEAGATAAELRSGHAATPAPDLDRFPTLHPHTEATGPIAAAWPRSSCSGWVVDAHSGAPIPHAAIRAQRELRNVVLGQSESVQTRSEADGSFRVQLERSRPYTLTVLAAGYLGTRLFAVQAQGPMFIALERGRLMRFRVFSRGQGVPQPLAGAVLRLATGVNSPHPDAVSAPSGADGSLELRVPVPCEERLWLSAPGHEERMLPTEPLDDLTNGLLYPPSSLGSFRGPGEDPPRELRPVQELRGRVLDARRRSPLQGIQVGWLGLGRWQAESDVEGRFTLRTGDGFRRQLWFRAAGRRIWAVSGQTIRDTRQPGVEMDFEIPAPEQLHLRACGPEGRVPRGLRVQAALFHAPGMSFELVEHFEVAMSADGTFRVPYLAGAPPDSWWTTSYVLEAPGYVARSLGGVLMSSARDEPIVLQRALPIRGRIVDGDGAGVAGALLRLSQASDRALELHTDAEGRFFSGELSTGSWRYEARARNPGLGPATGRFEQPGNQVGTQLLIRLDSRPHQTLRGRLLDIDGRPLRGYLPRLRLRPAAGGSSSTVRPDPEGRFCYTAAVVPDLFLELDPKDPRASAFLPPTPLRLRGEMQGLELRLQHK